MWNKFQEVKICHHAAKVEYFAFLLDPERIYPTPAKVPTIFAVRKLENRSEFNRFLVNYNQQYFLRISVYLFKIQ